MKKYTIQTIIELNDFLKKNKLWANGKNFSLDQIYATGSNSRWAYENIFGIYFAKPDYAWMALWMAIIDHDKIKKRNITYIHPEILSKDYIGKAMIYIPELNVEIKYAFCANGAYLYLIDPAKFETYRKIDITNIRCHDKIDFLLKNGFSQKEIEKKGKLQINYFPDSIEKRIIEIDSWQLALVNIDQIIPDIELFIKQEAINELSDGYTMRSESISDERYII